ncbi:MAG: hypothetical protein P8K08_17565 [Fuerstiella sp.]|jgi:hypothetical protein|nr:hypothetical protein [Fuerstiella sp.]
MTESTVRSGRRINGITFGVGISVSFCGYVSGWPVWLILLTLGAFPAARFCWWMYHGPLRRYRMLFGVAVALCVLGGFEAWQYKTFPEALTQSVDLPRSPGKPNLYFEYNLPGVLVELFPDEPESLFLRAVHLRLCAALAHQGPGHPFCIEYDNPEMNSVRSLHETALARNPKTTENLYYNYTEVLIQSAASQTEIDAAADEWRRLFPLSKRPDPRTAFADRVPNSI